MRILVSWLSLFFLSIVGVQSLAAAEESQKPKELEQRNLPTGPPEMPGQPAASVFMPQPGQKPPTPEEMQRQMEKFRFEMEKRRTRDMERIKQGPPVQGKPMEGLPSSLEEAKRLMEQRQAQDLERLKNENPKLYQERMESQEGQKKIDVILSAYQRGALSAQEAEHDLYPLVKETIQDEIQGLDAKIERLEKKLEALRKAKSDPDILVKKRIDQLLGRSTPPSGDVSVPGDTF